MPVNEGRYAFKHCGKTPHEHDAHNWSPAAEGSGAPYAGTFFCDGTEEGYLQRRIDIEVGKALARRPSVAELIQAADEPIDPLEANEAYAKLARKIDRLRDFIADRDNYHMYKPETVRVADIRQILEGDE